MAKGKARIYRTGLDGALRGAGLPYGYTLTIWAAGQVLAHEHGQPSVVSVFAFVLGGAMGFGLLKLVVLGVRPRVDPTQLVSDTRALRTGAIQVTSIGFAVGGAALIALAGTPLAWPLGSAVATAAYLGGTGLGMAMHEDERRQR